MKREDLEAKGLEKETIDFIMSENGKDVEKIKSKLTAAETARDDYKQQLEAANTTIQGYKEMDIEGIKKSVTDWENKYNTDTQALQAKLDNQAYEFALKEYVSGYQFTSELVKEAVIAQLKAQEFKLNDGKLLGADDFMKQLKEANPGAFVPEVDDKQPTITIPGAGKPTPGQKLTMSQLMKLKNENPDMDITPYLQ